MLVVIRSNLPEVVGGGPVLRIVGHQGEVEADGAVLGDGHLLRDALVPSYKCQFKKPEKLILYIVFFLLSFMKQPFILYVHQCACVRAYVCESCVLCIGIGTLIIYMSSSAY
jgi:hypothetical protein